jgi:hypothetical protein
MQEIPITYKFSLTNEILIAVDNTIKIFFGKEFITCTNKNGEAADYNVKYLVKINLDN